MTNYPPNLPLSNTLLILFSHPYASCYLHNIAQHSETFQQKSVQMTYMTNYPPIHLSTLHHFTNSWMTYLSRTHAWQNMCADDIYDELSPYLPFPTICSLSVTFPCALRCQLKKSCMYEVNISYESQTTCHELKNDKPIRHEPQKYRCATQTYNWPQSIHIRSLKY